MTNLATSALEVDSIREARTAAPQCFHCGDLCRGPTFTDHEKSFCCQGCLAVFQLLTENGLTDFYSLSENAGVRVKAQAGREQFAYLDDPVVQRRLVDFADARTTRVTFRLPSIHCIACVWLLENLFHLQPGIGQSRVNFPRQEVSIAYDPARTKLSEVVALLGSLGYEPELKLSDLDNVAPTRQARRLWVQLGIAGFAFGNIMLLSISSYLGLDHFSGGLFNRISGWISLLLALPVLFYSAADYWRSAWVSLKQRMLTIEVPIAAGLLALFLQSTYDVLTGAGVGYFDSLTGLLFFLLCGRLFQQKTFDRLAFDRDYKSLFPLSIIRKEGGRQEHVALSQLGVGDTLVLRHGELIPADATLMSGQAVIDYSFVTGESAPVEKAAGEYLYAGGRQTGGVIEIKTVKPVSQSYLASLWNQDAFRKETGRSLNNLTDLYSRRFTKIVIAVAVGSALFWAGRDVSRSLKSFTSVLIVACPCALALAAPFALGTAERILARRNIFLKDTSVIETLARVTDIVFDKTGTLTVAGANEVVFHGQPLTEAEQHWLYSMTHHSTHPHAVRITKAIGRGHIPQPVRSYLETAGCGIEGSVAGYKITIGSPAWLQSRKIVIPPMAAGDGSVVVAAINGQYRGAFWLANALRPETAGLLTELSSRYELALLSGDHDRERPQFAPFIGSLHFNQSPLDKLGFIRDRQKSQRVIMMVGDGLNDAGALKQSDVGVAVVENINAFSPASDVVMDAAVLPRLPEILLFAKTSVRIVRWSFVISSFYNLIGISIAASGRLSPLVCAILMPLSSITVVAFACGLTNWMGRKVQP